MCVCVCVLAIHHMSVSSMNRVCIYMCANIYLNFMCQRSTLSGFLDTSPHTETLSALDQQTLVLYPVHPSTLQEEKKSGEYSTTFLYLRQNLVSTI